MLSKCCINMVNIAVFLTNLTGRYTVEVVCLQNVVLTVGCTMEVVRLPNSVLTWLDKIAILFS